MVTFFYIILIQCLLVGVEGSEVIGYLRNGLFFGQLLYPNGDRFYIEKASQHFQHPVAFHSVIYLSSAAEDNHVDQFLRLNSTDQCFQVSCRVILIMAKCKRRLLL